MHFSARTLLIESRSMLPNLSLVMEFLENIFTNFIFEKLLSNEALVRERVTGTSNYQTRLCSYEWNKFLEGFRHLWLLPKQVLCQSHFMFLIIFTKWIWFSNSSKCFFDINVWPTGQGAEIRERIASRSLQKIRTKFYEVAGHVWVELKL